MMARPGIMLYFDILEPIRVLPDADKGRLLVAILEYGKDGVVPEFDGMLALAWGFVRPKLDRDEESYENALVQRKYAAFCKRRNARKLPKIPFEEWLEMDEDERQRMASEDNDPKRAVAPVGSRNPTTTTTAAAAATSTAPTSTPTTTKTTASTAAAAEGTTEEGLAAAAAERKMKMMGGELGRGVVALSDAQIESLLETMGVNMFDHYVGKLANFIIKNGASVKGHYATILRWWTEDSAC